MDLRAALAVLGLEEGPELTRDQVRRTYMRKLREHPPERDPEGFKKLREAYEMARHMPDPPPARSAPANVRLPHGLLVSIEAIAALPS